MSKNSNKKQIALKLIAVLSLILGAGTVAAGQMSTSANLNSTEHSECGGDKEDKHCKKCGDKCKCGDDCKCGDKCKCGEKKK